MDTSKIAATLFVATVKDFNGSNERPSEPDERGNMPIILDLVAGTCPNKRVLSGTVAMRAGMVVGNTYLCKVEEIGSDEYGRQFRFNTVSKLGVSDLLKSIKLFGAPHLVEVVENESEVTKSGHYSFPKGFKAKEKAEFEEMSAEDQDVYIEEHPGIRSHPSTTVK